MAGWIDDDGVLRRRARDSELLRGASLRTAAQEEQRPRDDRADAGGDHPAVLLGDHLSARPPMTVRRVVRIASSALLLGWGAALLARPVPVAATAAGTPVPPAWLVRVLGGRQVLQQLLGLAVPTPAVTRAAAGVDIVHGSSMLAAAVVWPRYRRPTLVSAAAAAASAVLAL